MTGPSLKGVRGFLIDAPDRWKLRAVRDGAVLIEDGRIAAVGPFDEVRREAPDARWHHSAEAVVIPGLIDLRARIVAFELAARQPARPHPKAEPQIARLNCGWNAPAARRVAPMFFSELARNGTTCAAVVGPTSPVACDAAFQAARDSGLRIVMGLAIPCAAANHRDHPPGERSPQDAVAQSERLCRKWHGAGGGRLAYAFSLDRESCAHGPAVAELAPKFDAYIELDLPDCPLSAADPGAPDDSPEAALAAYAEAGLLTDRTLLGRCGALGAAGAQRVAASNSRVVYAPSADAFCGADVLPLDTFEQAGASVGLASDAGRGPDVSLWRVMRSGVEAQRRRAHAAGVAPPGAVGMFHLATCGGARCLGLADAIGTIDIGKDADLVVLDVAAVVPYGLRGNVHADLSAEEIINLLVFRGERHAVVETFALGRSAYRAPSPSLC